MLFRSMFPLTRIRETVLCSICSGWMHFEGEASGMGETYYLRACPFCGTIPEVEEIPLWDREEGQKDHWKFDQEVAACS